MSGVYLLLLRGRELGAPKEEDEKSNCEVNKCWPDQARPKQWARNLSPASCSLGVPLLLDSSLPYIPSLHSWSGLGVGQRFFLNLGPCPFLLPITQCPGDSISLFSKVEARPTCNSLKQRIMNGMMIFLFLCCCSSFASKRNKNGSLKKCSLLSVS